MSPFLTPRGPQLLQAGSFSKIPRHCTGKEAYNSNRGASGRQDGPTLRCLTAGAEAHRYKGCADMRTAGTEAGRYDGSQVEATAGFEPANEGFADVKWRFSQVLAPQDLRPLSAYGLSHLHLSTLVTP